MPKAPIKEFKKTIEYYFTENQLDSSKSDLLAKEVLYFSNKIPTDELKEYLATNFNNFYEEGRNNTLFFPKVDINIDTVEHNILNLEGDMVGLSRYPLPDRFIVTVDAKMPIIDSSNDSYIPSTIITGLDDHDIGINYNREDIYLKLVKENGINTFNNFFTIVIDPITSEDLEAYLIQHYQSFFLLGIMSLKLNQETSRDYDMPYRRDLMKYQSNPIKAIESIGAKTL